MELLVTLVIVVILVIHGILVFLVLFVLFVLLVFYCFVCFSCLPAVRAMALLEVHDFLDHNIQRFREDLELPLDSLELREFIVLALALDRCLERFDLGGQLEEFCPGDLFLALADLFLDAGHGRATLGMLALECLDAWNPRAECDGCCYYLLCL